LRFFLLQGWETPNPGHQGRAISHLCEVFGRLYLSNSAASAVRTLAASTRNAPTQIEGLVSVRRLNSSRLTKLTKDPLFAVADRL
jgi:hypothetical protein